MKIVAFIIFFVVLNNSSFGKTLSYTTYFGDIEIDDVNGQVVFNHSTIYNIIDVNNNSGRIYLEDEYGEKRMLEYKQDRKFNSFNIYFYKDRFELYGNFKIMSYKEKENEPSVHNPSIQFIPLGELILKEYFGGNKKLFMSDAWYLKSINDRINIVCDTYLKVLRVKTFNTSNLVCYDNYNDMVSKGDLNKLIKLLENRNLLEAKEYLYRIGFADDYKLLYYYDESENKWVCY